MSRVHVRHKQLYVQIRQESWISSWEAYFYFLFGGDQHASHAFTKAISSAWICWISGGSCEWSARPYSSQWWTAPELSMRKISHGGKHSGQNRNIPGINLNGLRVVSGLGLASSLCGVSGLQGSTTQKHNTVRREWIDRKWNERLPSPSMIASLSAAISKSPKALTAVTFGNGGTWKNSPGR